MFTVLPTLFWTGEPLEDPLNVNKRSNVYFDKGHNHIKKGPYRSKWETLNKSQSTTSPRVPTITRVLIKRVLEALTGQLQSSPKKDEEVEGRALRIKKRISSPAVLQDLDIGEIIRSMVCPQCLLEGFVFGAIFVSCD